MTGTNRDRGIVSPADRSYLRGETDFGSIQSERNARARIRDRIYDAILDFEPLVEHLEDRDRELVFAKRFDRLDGVAAFDAMVSALAFLYLAIAETDLEFDAVLAEGINVAEAKSDRAATVDLDVTFHSLTVGELRHKLERGDSLSLTELAYLHQSEEMRPDELARYFRDDDASRIDDGRIQSKVTSF